MLVGTFIVLAIILGFWSYTKATGTVISACVTKNGDVRIPADGACRNTETPISWNVQGPKGDRGDKGDQGAPGQITNTFIVKSSTSGGSWDSVTSDAVCPTDSTLVSGGAYVSALVAPSRSFLNGSFPLSTTTWRGTATAVDAGAGGITLTTYALCAQKN